jgi:hypothetical protein
MLDKTQYDLIILYMLGNYSPPFPQIYAETITFTQEEIRDNWDRIMTNKIILDDTLLTNIPPEPFKYCYDWECKFCRYKLTCDALVTVGIRSLQ